MRRGYSINDSGIFNYVTKCLRHNGLKLWSANNVRSMCFEKSRLGPWIAVELKIFSTQSRGFTYILSPSLLSEYKEKEASASREVAVRIPSKNDVKCSWVIRASLACLLRSVTG